MLTLSPRALTLPAAMGPVILRFHLLPSMHYVVVTPASVKKATGIYYERIFGGGDAYAKAWDGARLPSSPLRYFLHSASPAPSLAFFTLRSDLAGVGFFCGITEKFVTSNLNKNNLELECVTYA
eukprot:scaffold22771_cov59-Phaeocystis_antarctica.AAC.2